MNGLSEEMNEYLSELYGGKKLVQLIDFEDLKWGSFTEQFNAYKRQYPKTNIKDLDEFASFVLAHPTKFKERTKKRARFYKNIIMKGKGKVEGNNIVMPKKEFFKEHRDLVRMLTTISSSLINEAKAQEEEAKGYMKGKGKCINGVKGGCGLCDGI